MNTTWKRVCARVQPDMPSLYQTPSLSASLQYSHTLELNIFFSRAI